jgi:hypothetical protein
MRSSSLIDSGMYFGVIKTGTQTRSLAWETIGARRVSLCIFNIYLTREIKRLTQVIREIISTTGLPAKERLVTRLSRDAALRTRHLQTVIIGFIGVARDKCPISEDVPRHVTPL